MSEAASPTGISSTGMVVPITQVGALSQAWYDALGYEFRKPQKSVPVKTMKTVDAAEPRKLALPTRRVLSPFEIAQRNETAARLRRPAKARFHVRVCWSLVMCVKAKYKLLYIRLNRMSFGIAPAELLLSRVAASCACLCSVQATHCV